MIDKKYFLEKAMEIGKEYARSGHSPDIAAVIGEVYTKLVRLAEDAEQK
jgi:hypothetical protein